MCAESTFYASVSCSVAGVVMFSSSLWVRVSMRPENCEHDILNSAEPIFVKLTSTCTMGESWEV